MAQHGKWVKRRIGIVKDLLFMNPSRSSNHLGTLYKEAYHVSQNLIPNDGKTVEILNCMGPNSKPTVPPYQLILEITRNLLYALDASAVLCSLREWLRKKGRQSCCDELLRSLSLYLDQSLEEDMFANHASDISSMLQKCNQLSQDGADFVSQLNQEGVGPGARSSHAITIVGQKAYAFGGEFKPRVPVDNDLYVFDLTDQSWSVAKATGDIPPPRVGVTMSSVGGTIYVFGGRDTTHKELNELYSFNTLTNKWTLLSSGVTGPPHRSYHSVAADDRRIYIFGGCGDAGRLNDLWAYDVVDQSWIKYPDAGEHCKGRGGPGLAVVEGKIWVVYGFAGMEVDDVHCFDPVDQKWAQVETSGEKPTPRSVFSTVGIGKYIFICGGEVDPSDLGHLGAGRFTNGTYVLDTETLIWKRCDDGSDSSDDHPGARGWCAFAAGKRDGKEGLLVYGGNSPSNDRLGDIFFFTPSLDSEGK